MKATQKEADHRKDDSPKATLKAPMGARLSAPMNAPWPDQKARQEMSQSELACFQDEKGGGRRLRQKLAEGCGQSIAGFAQPEDAAD